jgi:hypothetical protein
MASFLLYARPIESPAVQTWDLFEDADSGRLTVRLPPHLSRVIADEASAALAARLQTRSEPTRAVIDLFDVEWFDVTAPLVGIRNLTPVVDRIDALDFIVRNRALRTAAISAAHVLGLRFRIRDHRDGIQGGDEAGDV